MMNSRFRFVGLILAVLLLAAATQAQVQVVNSLITTFAGHGTGCAGETDSLGDGCPAADSVLRNPTGVAVDSAGNLYIVDQSDEVVRKVNAATGEITTVAGNGTGGYGGDNGPATSAELQGPNSVALDSTGNLYISDYINQRIRMVIAATGVITTIAGNGTSGYTGDNNPATSAELRNPSGIAVNPAGTVLYIGDSGNNVVRMVNLTTGIITTFAGNGSGSGTTGGGYTGDNGPATSAEMWSPSGVALDASGNLYIADTYNSAIRKVSASTGKISTVAGNGSPNYAGDGGLATLANLYYPSGVTVDSAGNLYIADSYNCLIRKVNAVTGIITTVAGNPQDAGLGQGTFGGDNGPATLGLLNIPDGVAVDSNGNLYIADTLNNAIRKVAAPNSHLSLPQTNVGSASASQDVQLYISSYCPDNNCNNPGGNSLAISSVTVAQSLGGLQEYTVGAISGCVADGVTPVDAGSLCTVPITFHPGYPGLRQAPLEVVTSAGTFYFGLSGIGLGPQPALLPGVISTVAGTGATGYTGDNGPATSATFSGVYAVAIDYAGNEYIDDYNNNVFRKVTAATGIVTTFAGNGTQGYTGDNFPATSAELNIDWGAGTDGAGNVFIADTNNNVIREVNAVTGIITTVAGTCCASGGEGLQGYNGDNIPATSAELFLPEGVATDSSGNIYIADYGNNRVREVNVATGVITTVAGNGYGNGAHGTGGYTGDNGPATSAELTGPSAVALDAGGNIFIADFFNNVVRKVTVATGIITTVAGDGTHGDTGDNGPATSAELGSPIGVAVDAAGDLYIDGYGTAGGSIRKVDAATGIITTVAGGGNGCTGQTDSIGDGCGATSAIVGAQNLAVDGAGNLYIADGTNNRVRKVSLTTAPIIFPQTAVNSNSAALTFKVANIGTAPLNLSAITPSTNFNVDSGTTTCSTSDAVAAGGSCVIGVVFSPTAGGALTGTLTLTDNALNVAGTTQQVVLNGTIGTVANNPVPTITTLLPTGTTAGSGAFTLTVNGSGFINGSVVNFNGTPKATTYVSATQVTAAILATDVASVGTPAVTVTNPAPGGGTSNAVTFNVTAAQTTPTVTVTPSPTSITTTQALTVTVGVSGGSGNPTPTGSVTLTSGSYTSAAATLSGGSATINIPAGSLAAGTDTLSVSYTPDSSSSSTYSSAIGSNAVTVTTPAKITPTLTVTPSPTSITSTQALTVTVGVGGGGGHPTPTGSVTLTSGSYTSAAATLSGGGATINIPAGSLGAGTDTLSVSYTPDSASSTTYNSATGSNTVSVTAATVQVIVGTSPAGLSFSVDGTSYSSAQTLSWTVGSSHTIATTSPQTSGGTQNTFASWSDEGAISHSVTAPSSAASYTATFTTSYQLTTAASPASDGTVAPASGSYYAAGTVVNLAATPNSSYIFSNWTGNVANSASASTTVTMNAPQSVTANFAAVTASAAPIASLTAPAAFPSTTTGATSVAQAATLANTGNAALAISGITITGTNPTDFAITTGENACGTTLAADASCSIYVTFTPASAASFTATLSVADNASGSPQTAALTGTGTAPPNFTMASPTGAQTVQPGGAATYTVSITPVNGAFTGVVTLGASGLPIGATATFVPPTVTPGSTGATSQLTIQTAATKAEAAPGSPWPLALPTLSLVGLFLLPGKHRRRWITLSVLLFASLTAAAALSGCGGGFGLGNHEAGSTSYTITVTGNSGAIQQTTTMQLTVE